MTDIVWEDPPRDARENERHAATAAELKAHPGKWAKIATQVTDTFASNIRRGSIKAYLPAESFQVAVRKAEPADGRRRVDVYARYIGTPEDSS